MYENGRASAIVKLFVFYLDKILRIAYGELLKLLPNISYFFPL